MIETLSFRLNCFSVNDYVTDLNNLEISPLLTPVCVSTIYVCKKTGVIYPGGGGTYLSDVVTTWPSHMSTPSSSSLYWMWTVYHMSLWVDLTLVREFNPLFTLATSVSYGLILRSKCKYHIWSLNVIQLLWLCYIFW